jgi:TonB family protein
VIALWMLYCVGIGLAFVVVGHALERALHFAGRPTRWAWVIALAGSYVVPIAAWVRPDAFATFAVPIPVAAESGPILPTSTTSPTIDQPPPSAFSLTDLDPALRWGWILVSGGMLVGLTLATARLLSMRRRWRRSVVDGRDVLVSSDVGPAVVGWWSPRVVLPEWTLALPDAERELMLAHEEQHVRAKDPALLALAIGSVLVAPWNLALWWQWRRLRLAVEMDCDARVLRQGRSPSLYGELLLRIGARRHPRIVSVAAFGEPVSFLESRIHGMVARLPRWRWAGAAAAALVASAAIVVACETPRPMGPPPPVAALSGIPESPATAEVLTESALDERPDFLSGPALGYPELLRRAGIGGRVVLQAIIDTAGRAEPTSIKVVSSPNPGFNESAKQWLLHALFRPATVHGRAVRALISIPFNFDDTRQPNASVATQSLSAITVRMTERLRPWVEANARRFFPSILEPNGPPMNAFLVHDSRLQVYRGTLTTLNYLGPSGSRLNTEFDVAELKRALPSFNPGHDGWAVMDQRGLRGLVRDNVRVIRINHDPEPQDTAASSGGLSDQEMNRRAEQVRRFARQYHPELFGQSRSQVAIALVLDSHETVVAHAARADEARAAGDGVYASGESCLDVLNRLIPEYKTAQWSQSGCAVEKGTNVIVYWGQLMKP